MALLRIYPREMETFLLASPQIKKKKNYTEVFIEALLVIVITLELV